MSFFKKPTGGRFGEDDSFGAKPAPVMQDTQELDDFTVPDTAAPAPSFGGVNLGASSIELKVVKPDKFDDVAPIADHLMQHRTVVLNLESTNKEIQRRMIDFLSGIAYAIDGQIKRVANATYIITPSNVDVSDGAPAHAAPVQPAEPVAKPEDDFSESGL